MKEKSSSKANLFLAILFLIITLVAFLSWQNPNFGDKFNVGNWFNSESLETVTFWAAIGFVFLACFLGALIPIPIPYALPITIFAGIWINSYEYPWVPILAMVFIATLANTLGDFLDYAIGMGTEKVLSKDDPELQNRWSQIVLKKPESIPGIIFLFGLTPLPDSMLLVPLGMVGYDKKKILIWMYLGKVGMMFLNAIAGIWTIDWLMAIVSGEGNKNGWIFGIVLLYIIWFMVLFMVKYKPNQSEDPKTE